MAGGKLIVAASKKVASNATAALAAATPVIRSKFFEFVKNMGYVVPVVVAGDYASDSLQKFFDSNLGTDGDAAVIAEALVRSGISPEALIDDAVVKADPRLGSLLEKLRKLTDQSAKKAVKHADKTLDPDDEDAIARDILREERVAVALSIYGTGARYALCHPNGGIPPYDFVWYEATRRARSQRRG